MRFVLTGNMLSSREAISETNEESETPRYDIIVISGGVIGSLISYQISKHDLSACLLERKCDLAMKESGANSAIVHAGYDPKPSR